MSKLLSKEQKALGVLAVVLRAIDKPMKMGDFVYELESATGEQVFSRKEPVPMTAEQMSCRHIMDLRTYTCRRCGVTKAQVIENAPEVLR